MQIEGKVALRAGDALSFDRYAAEDRLWFETMAGRPYSPALRLGLPGGSPPGTHTPEGCKTHGSEGPCYIIDVISPRPRR